MDKLGSWLKAERLKNNVGLRKLASALGVSPTYQSQMERGLATSASDKYLLKVIEAFGADPDTIFGLASKIAPDMKNWVLEHSKMVRSMMEVPSVRKSED